MRENGIAVWSADSGSEAEGDRGRVQQIEVSADLDCQEKGVRIYSADSSTEVLCSACASFAYLQHLS